MISKILKSIIPLLYTAILYSCTTNTVYHKFQAIDNDSWNRKDTLYFIISDSMAIGNYNTELGIRHTEEYPYKDLWLSVVYLDTEKADTVHIYLANDRGSWNSSGSTGGYFQYSISGKELNYQSPNDSVIKISHIMNDNPLKGITDIGLKIIRK